MLLNTETQNFGSIQTLFPLKMLLFEHALFYLIMIIDFLVFIDSIMNNPLCVCVFNIFIIFVSFGSVYIVKDVCSCGPLIRVRRVEEWRKAGKTTVFISFCSYIWGK